MGTWKTERGYGSDAWADEFGRMMKNLSKMRLAESHEITVVELADLVEFCSRGHIRAEVREGGAGSRAISGLHADHDIETLPNRGQIHCEAVTESA